MNYLANLLVPTAHAQAARGNFLGVFRFRAANQNTTAVTVLDFVIVVINWFLVIIAVLAFVYLVIYGVKYITSGGDATKATEARNGIINAIIGLIVIALAFFIIRFAANFGFGGTNP